MNTPRPGTLRETALPADLAENLAVCPTLNRWGTVEKHGPLVDLVRSLEERVSEEGMKDNTAIILGDASEGPGVDAARIAGLSHATNVVSPARVFILTMEQRRAIAQRIEKVTRVDRRAIQGLLLDTGYGSQRGNMWLAAAGLARARGEDMRKATFDDDTKIDGTYRMVRPEKLPRPFRPEPNSQLVLPEDDVRLDEMTEHGNQLSSFFAYLGTTVADMRKQFPGMPATEIHKDTMHSALSDVRERGSAQFVVSHEGKDVDDAHLVRLFSAVISKHGRPDYRTLQIAQMYLESEFPQHELPLLSFLSGEVQPYAHRGSKTNVDSANIAFLLNDRTTQIMPWFVSDHRISAQNPLGTVEGHYRSDNELLPKMFDPKLAGAWGEPGMYLSGLPTQVYHNRAATGAHRVDTHKQATQSTLGHVAAMQAFARMEVDPLNKRIVVRDVEDSFEVPHETAEALFDQIYTLAEICHRKGKELARRTPRDDEHRRQIETALGRYQEIYADLKRRLADFDLQEFHKHLNVEVRDQVRYYKAILDAYPVMLEEIARMIKRGEYPATEFVPAGTPTRAHVNGTPPGSNGTPAGHDARERVESEGQA